MYFANKTNCQVGLEPFSARLFCAVENLYRAEILLKIDHFTQEPLAGVTFDLLDADDKVVQSGLATNAEGKITVPNLKAGSYQFVEKTTLPDYQLAAPLKFDLVDEGTLTLTLTNKLIPGSVKLTKVRAGYPNPKLKGAVFTLEDETRQTGKDKDGLEPKELTTDDNGERIVENLNPGKYQFVETKAPAGYMRTSKPN